MDSECGLGWTAAFITMAVKALPNQGSQEQKNEKQATV